MTITLDSKIPDGPMEDKWDNFIAHEKLVNPANKRKFKVIVVGTGRARSFAFSTVPTKRSMRENRGKRPSCASVRRRK